MGNWIVIGILLVLVVWSARAVWKRRKKGCCGCGCGCSECREGRECVPEVRIHRSSAEKRE